MSKNIIEEIIFGNISKISVDKLIQIVGNICKKPICSTQNTWFLSKNETFYNDKITHLDNGTIILPFCFFEGPTTIFPNCRIGPFAYLRPGSIIGNNTRIGHSVEIKESIVATDVSIAHRSYLGNSIVGKKSMIGVGFSVCVRNYQEKTIQIRDIISKKVISLSPFYKFGAIIEENVWISSHVVLMPGSIVKANSILNPFNSYGGSKGKVIC